MNRLLRSAIATTATALALSACGQPTAVAPKDSLSTSDVLYLNELQHGSVDVYRTRRWLSHGKDTCRALAHNDSVPTVAEELTEAMRSAEASVVIVAAVHHYCPWLAAKNRIPQ